MAFNYQIRLTDGSGTVLKEWYQRFSIQLFNNIRIQNLTAFHETVKEDGIFSVYQITIENDYPVAYVTRLK